ncbi:MAG: flagellar hook-associated protein 1 FlgK [Hyphomonadaceae bacterium]|nr:MAG: flagellar hook-associated protein 1 FlgK [Hyphomonadaceae bacterium]
METAIQSGKLRGLLDVRNHDLPDMAEYLGEFAAKFADAVNAVHNVSASLPALVNAQGVDTGLLSGDALGFTGQTALGIVATDGSLQRKINIDFDLGTISVNGGPTSPIGASIGSFVTALNTALGGVGSASFSGGALRITNSVAGNGVVFDEPLANQSLRGDKAFAHFFGLNNLVNSSQQTSFSTGLKSTDAHGFTVGDTFEMRLVSPNGAIMTDKTITIPAGNIGNIITSLNNGATGFGLYGSFGLDNGGAIRWTPNSGNEAMKLEMTKDTAPRTGSTLAFGQLFGFSQGARMARGSALSVNSQIAADPRKLGLAMPDLTSVAIGAIALGLGDSRGAQAIFDVTKSRLNFYSGLGVQGRSMTLGEFVSSIAGDLGTRTASAEANMNSAQNIKTEADTRRSNIEGVNLDEELIKLTAFQQAYSASARMIKAADEMYAALLAAV